MLTVILVHQTLINVLRNMCSLKAQVPELVEGTVTNKQL